MDNRDFTRIKYDTGASITYGNEVVFCNTDNLSLHGMYLKTKQEIPLSIPVQVTVYHSERSSLKVNAVVVRREINGVGVQICNVDVNSFVQLRNIITEYSNDRDAVMQETYKMLQCIN